MLSVPLATLADSPLVSSVASSPTSPMVASTGPPYTGSYSTHLNGSVVLGCASPGTYGYVPWNPTVGKAGVLVSAQVGSPCNGTGVTSVVAGATNVLFIPLSIINASTVPGTVKLQAKVTFHYGWNVSVGVCATAKVNGSSCQVSESVGGVIEVLLYDFTSNTTLRALSASWGNSGFPGLTAYQNTTCTTYGCTATTYGNLTNTGTLTSKVDLYESWRSHLRAIPGHRYGLEVGFVALAIAKSYALGACSLSGAAVSTSIGAAISVPMITIK